MKKPNLGPFLIFPSAFMIFFLLVFPVGYSFFLSLFQMQGFSRGPFVGFDNFVRVLTNREIVTSLQRTVYVSLTGGLLSVVVGYLIAYWATRVPRGLGTFVQALTLVPWVTSMIVAALLWRWVFAGQFAVFNYFRSLLGMEPLRLLSGGGTAMATMIFVLVWRTVGFCVIMLVAALNTVPKELEEASQVDGCNVFQRNWHVVLPSIKTQVLITAIVVTLSHFNNATIPLALTGGGPAGQTNVASLELYRLAFVFSDYGKAIALAVVVFGLNILLVIAYMRAANRGLGSS